MKVLLTLLIKVVCLLYQTNNFKKVEDSRYYDNYPNIKLNYLLLIAGFLNLLQPVKNIHHQTSKKAIFF